MCIYYVSCVFTFSGCGVFDCVIQCARCNLEFACLSTSPLSLCVFVRMYKCVFDSDAMMPGTGRREARHSSHSYDATVTLDQSGRCRQAAAHSRGNDTALLLRGDTRWDREGSRRQDAASFSFVLTLYVVETVQMMIFVVPARTSAILLALPSFLFFKKLSKVCKKLPNQNFVRLKSNFNDI